ncbi:hypothetical protein [Mucisphaera sp.]|uniref:hypothetical protein n=1 Tax=Mucisphaera sp. TaxID=2913024 RepID=UPI003D12B2A6
MSAQFGDDAFTSRLAWQTRPQLTWNTLAPGRLTAHLAETAKTHLSEYDVCLQAGSAYELIDLYHTQISDNRQTFHAFVRTLQQWLALQVTTETALQVERYRLRTGRWPSSLADLDLPIPRDPYASSDQPVLYSKLDSRVSIYSIGSNRVDDGGTQTGDNWSRDEDIVFRLLHPELRGNLTDEYWRKQEVARRQRITDEFSSN